MCKRSVLWLTCTPYMQDKLCQHATWLCSNETYLCQHAIQLHVFMFGMHHIYVNMWDNYVNMRLKCMIMLHIDLIYLVCRGEKFATISRNRYYWRNVIFADCQNQCYEHFFLTDDSIQYFKEHLELSLSMT